jgi:hypothetical protein
MGSLLDATFIHPGWVTAQVGHEKVTTTENHCYKWRPTEASKQYANVVR